MKTWQIVLLIVIIAIVLYFVLRSHTPSVTDSATITPKILGVPRAVDSAPGVIPTTGQVPTPPPPPPPPSTAIPRNWLSAALNPVHVAIGSMTPLGVIGAANSVLQHVPVVGPVAGVASKVVSAPVNIAGRAVSSVNKTVGNTLEHVPVVGGVLAAPTKVVGKIGSIFGF